MIKVQAAAQSLRHVGGPIALLHCEDEGLSLHAFAKGRARMLIDQAKKERAKGRVGEVVAVSAGAQKVLLVGLGKRKAVDADALRKAAGRAARYCHGRYASLGLAVPDGVEGAAGALAEGAMLASYRYTKYRKPKGDDRPVLRKAVLLAAKARLKAAERDAKRASVACEAVAMVRDLVNEGPSDKQPETMAEKARNLSNARVKVEVFDKDKLDGSGMNAILGVARGSGEVEPRFVHLTYTPDGVPKKRVALVGKGITFDSGGLSLKPAQSMETMKCDMAGAAAVLGVFKALAKLKPAVEVHGFAPFTSNLPGADALKPGDILKAYNGKTIEVLNTDAEGRLVLADALAYASRMKFDAIIDLATLTGAAVVALGRSITCAMTNDRDLFEAVKRSSERAGEPIWELPLPAEYKGLIKSRVADLKNIGPRGQAGTIVAGLFLAEFVDSTPWLHLDIAGPAWADNGSALQQPGGTGAMVRTLLDCIENL